MKFPLRLTLDLWRGRFSQPVAKGGTIFHLPAALLPALHENGAQGAFDGKGPTAAESVRAAAHSQAPVLWIGGSEPLDHAEVGRVAFALNAKGRNVFVHTDGQRLRQRIHEFRPESRLFLTVELVGREEVHDRAVRRPGAFRRVIEGIRAAKLSGFYVCAHVTVTKGTDPCETGETFEYLDRYDVDGIVVSSGGRRAIPADTELCEKLDEVRTLLRCSRWENFSKLLENSYALRRVLESAVRVTGEEQETVEEAV